MTTTFIYALCEPLTGEIRYVGKANSPRKRLLKHLRDSSKHPTYLGNWLRMLGVLRISPVLEILDEVPESQWQFWEREYIRVFRALGMRLVNATDGGEGVTMTSEIRAKIGAKQRGSVHTPEHCAKTAAKLGLPHTLKHNLKIGKSLLGTKHTPEFGLAIRNRQLGKVLPVEWCENIRRSKLGLRASKETKEKMKVSQQERREKESALGGRKNTDESKARQSEAMKASWARRKGRPNV